MADDAAVAIRLNVISIASARSRRTAVAPWTALSTELAPAPEAAVLRVAWLVDLAAELLPARAWAPTDARLATALIEAAGGAAAAASKVRCFVQRRRQELDVTLDALRSTPDGTIVAQAAALLALALLEEEPYSLRETWLRAAGPLGLNVLAESWGRPY